MMQRLDFIQLVLVLLIGLHILELAVIGFASAWSVQVVRNDQRRIEQEWRQVLQILAHGRTSEHDRVAGE